MGKIVLTGSSGAVGSGVAAYIIQNSAHSLVLIDAKIPSKPLDDPRVTYVTANLSDPTVWAAPMNGADALIHFAALAQPWHASQAATHNINVSLSYNALCAAVEAGVKRVVMASSINAIGGCWDPNMPKYVYFPIDELHPPQPVEAYSLSKLMVEIQSECVARANPDMSIASLRFHFVNPLESKPSHGHRAAHTAKDLWGWTNSEAAARACLLALEMGDDHSCDEATSEGGRGRGKGAVKGHEVFFVVAEKHVCESYTAMGLARQFFPETKILREMEPGEGFYDCSKAERILGWKHEGGDEPRGDW